MTQQVDQKGPESQLFFRADIGKAFFHLSPTVKNRIAPEKHIGQIGKLRGKVAQIHMNQGCQGPLLTLQGVDGPVVDEAELSLPEDPAFNRGSHPNGSPEGQQDFRNPFMPMDGRPPDFLNMDSVRLILIQGSPLKKQYFFFPFFSHSDLLLKGQAMACRSVSYDPSQ